MSKVAIRNIVDQSETDTQTTIFTKREAFNSRVQELLAKGIRFSYDPVRMAVITQVKRLGIE